MKYTYAITLAISCLVPTIAQSYGGVDLSPTRVPSSPYELFEEWARDRFLQSKPKTKEGWEQAHQELSSNIQGNTDSQGLQLDSFDVDDKLSYEKQCEKYKHSLDLFKKARITKSLCKAQMWVYPFGFLNGLFSNQPTKKRLQEMTTEADRWTSDLDCYKSMQTLALILSKLHHLRPSSEIFCDIYDRFVQKPTDTFNKDDYDDTTREVLEQLNTTSVQHIKEKYGEDSPITQRLLMDGSALPTGNPKIKVNGLIVNPVGFMMDSSGFRIDRSFETKKKNLEFVLKRIDLIADLDTKKSGDWLEQAVQASGAQEDDASSYGLLSTGRDDFSFKEE